MDLIKASFVIVVLASGVVTAAKYAQTDKCYAIADTVKISGCDATASGPKRPAEQTLSMGLTSDRVRNEGLF